jgi:hypothetical protein
MRHLEHLSQSTQDIFLGKKINSKISFAALEENKSLKTLNVSHFSSSFKSLSTLAMAMTANMSLESLRLDGAGVLGIHLPAMKGIQKLNLHINPFDTTGAKQLAEGTREKFSLTSLEIATGCSLIYMRSCSTEDACRGLSRRIQNHGILSAA